MSTNGASWAVAVGRRRHCPAIVVLELLQCALNIVGLIDPERPLRSIPSYAHAQNHVYGAEIFHAESVRQECLYPVNLLRFACE
jgi:hypothetical protein